MNWLQKTAMFVVGDGEYLIAYKSSIFLINPNKQDVDDPIIRQMANVLGTETRELVSKHRDTWDYIDHLRDQRPDILLGIVDGNNLTLQTGDFQHRSGSRLLQNVMKTLGISNVNYQGEYDEQNLSDWQVTGDLPEFMFHGTTSQYADLILRFGLQPGQSESNYSSDYGSIDHQDVVFLAEDVNRAAYHASNAVQSQEGFPVVFRFKIPDPSLLVSDYDAEVMYNEEFEGNVYDNTYKHPQDKFSPRIQEEPFGFSKKIGVMGYRGRIPANFIIDIMIRPEGGGFYGYSDNEWVSVTAAQLQMALENGDPQMYSYEPEEDEEEWNDDNAEERIASNWLQKIAQKGMPLPTDVPRLDRQENAGISRIDEMMTQETANRLNQQYPEIEYNKPGSKGITYKKTGPNEIMKVTPHWDEVNTVKSLFENPVAWAVPILKEPQMIQEYPPMWSIHMKELQTLDGELDDFVTGLAFKKVDNEFPGPDEVLFEVEASFPDNVEEVMNLYNQVAYLFDQNEKNPLSPDIIHGGNVGWDDDGMLKVFDFGPAKINQIF